MAPNIKVTFTKLIQDVQELGSDECMVSRVFFAVSADGQSTIDAHADIKQSVGSKYEDAELEVGQPQGYDGPWNHDAFADAARQCYLKLVNKQGAVISVGGSGGIRMHNNTFVLHDEVVFQASGGDAGW